MKSLIVFAVACGVGVVVAMKFGRVWASQVAYLLSPKDGQARAMRVQRTAFERVKVQVVPDVQGRRQLPTEVVIGVSAPDYHAIDPVRKSFCSSLADELMRVAEDQDWRIEGRPVVVLRTDPGARDGRPRVSTSFAAATVAFTNPTEDALANPTDRYGQQNDHWSFDLVDADGHRRPITSTGVTIGRSPHSTIKIDHTKVSRNHARIAMKGSTIVVSDDGSKNGTTVNGTTVNGDLAVTAPAEIVVAKIYKFTIVDPRDQPTILM